VAAHPQHQALGSAARAGPRQARTEERVPRGVARAELQGEPAVGPGRRGHHARGVRVLQRRQRRHVSGGLAEQRVLGAVAPSPGEARHLVVLVRLRPLVGAPPQAAQRVERRLVGQQQPQRREREGGVREHAGGARGVQWHGCLLSVMARVRVVVVVVVSWTPTSCTVADVKREAGLFKMEEMGGNAV